MEIKKTPLYNEHMKLKALMAPFAGWEMPIHYGSVIEEAKHTRVHTSVFDICHMGELFIKEGPANSSLDKIVTVPVTKMSIGRCRYGFLLNENGTIIDDLIIYRLAEDEWMVVINASNEEADSIEISMNLSPEAKFENRSGSTAKLDVQGPGSRDVMEKIAGPGVKELKYFGFNTFEFLGGKFIVSRTGYTGELGYEIYIDSDKAAECWNKFMEHENVKPAGLGSRDILRLEVGYPLYGYELTAETTPVEAGFGKFLDLEKEFRGKKALDKQMKQGTAKKLIGFEVEGRRTPRHENKIIAGGKETGKVTSGVFSPHLNKGVGMGYIDSAYSGNDIEIDLGRGTVKAKIVDMPFVKETSIKN